MMQIEKPHPSEYPAFYETYIRLITNPDIITLLENQEAGFHAFAKSMGADKENFRYAEGKWSVKEVIGHVIEVERIMAYRALAISRGDKQPLPGMDENNYIQNSNYENIQLKDLAEEFHHVRSSNIYLIRAFTEKMLSEEGIANGKAITVRALIYVIAGHLEHHVQILRDRYL